MIYHATLSKQNLANFQAMNHSIFPTYRHTALYNRLDRLFQGTFRFSCLPFGVLPEIRNICPHIYALNYKGALDATRAGKHSLIILPNFSLAHPAFIYTNYTVTVTLYTQFSLEDIKSTITLAQAYKSPSLATC